MMVTKIKHTHKRSVTTLCRERMQDVSEVARSVPVTCHTSWKNASTTSVNSVALYVLYLSSFISGFVVSYILGVLVDASVRSLSRSYINYCRPPSPVPTWARSPHAFIEKVWAPQQARARGHFFSQGSRNSIGQLPLNVASAASGSMTRSSCA